MKNQFCQGMGSGAAVFVLGPAGSGKSTFCQHLLQHCAAISRPAHLFNLDPAAETTPEPIPSPTSSATPVKFSPSKDIKDLVTVAEVMEEMGLGPNGGLIYALETLLEHREWLEDDLDCYEEEFLVIDCPGQIELYTHHDIIPKLLAIFEQHGYRACTIYMMESQFMLDVTKFFSGVLNATAAMMQLAVPHINVISKMDLISEQMNIEDGDDTDWTDVMEDYHPLHRFFFPDPRLLQERISAETPQRFNALNEALTQLIDEFDLVNFSPLDVRSEECLARIMSLIDNATQYSEMLEPKEPKEYEEPDHEDDNYGGEEYLDYIDDLNGVD